MDKRTRGYLWIALGVVLLLVMVGGVLVIGGGYWFYQQVAPQEQRLDPEAAAQELDAIRARFAGRAPIFDLEESGEGQATVRLRPDSTRPASPARITSIRVVAYNPAKRTLVRFSVPFWLLRYTPNAKITISEDGTVVEGGEGTPFTVRELERIGPALLVDDTDADGEQVIVWTE
ncbi:MAG TPA: hypothetical protein VF198_07500 [Vicinamibacterales bacterium]